MSDLYSWRWALCGLVPVGVASGIGLLFSMLCDPPRQPARLDWIGFLSLSAAISCVQLVLSRGQRLDWFESPEIWIETIAAFFAFYIFLTHSLTAQRPFLNLRLLLDRNYALGLALVGVFGMLNVTPMVLLPPLLQQHAGFPDAMIGEVLAARGVGATIGFFAAMFIGRLDPRIGMTIGFSLQMISRLWLMSVNLDVGIDIPLANTILQGMAIGIIWVPLTIASFATPDSRFWPEAMSVLHLLRHIGSSFFISMCVADIVRVTAQNYSRLSELISPFNDRLALPLVFGGWGLHTPPGPAAPFQEVNPHAAAGPLLHPFSLQTL